MPFGCSSADASRQMKPSELEHAQRSRQCLLDLILVGAASDLQRAMLARGDAVRRDHDTGHPDSSAGEQVGSRRRIDFDSCVAAVFEVTEEFVGAHVPSILWIAASAR